MIMKVLQLSCFTLFSMIVVKTLAFPRGYPPLAIKEESMTDEQESADENTITDLGSLSTVHAVGLAANPNNPDTILYADETAIYEFNKNTGDSNMMAGAASSGLLAMRTSVDGVGLDAKFKYITKIISRKSGLYIFDFDSLRRYDYDTKEVSLVIHLSSHDPSENRPLTGAVSEDEMTVYWTSTGGEGHVIRKVGIPDGKLSEATVVTGGPTLVAHMELSSDERHLLLSDVDMLLVEMVEIATGDISFVTQYGQQDFFPGSMTVVEDTLYIVNRDKLTINKIDITEEQTTLNPLCDTTCALSITNPFSLAFDASSNEIYILDASFHPSLPTYNFSIKSLRLNQQGEDKPKGDNDKADFDKMMQLYSRWFSKLTSKQ